MHISRVYGSARQPIRKFLRPDGTEIKKVLPDGREVSPIDWPTYWHGYKRDVSISEVASLYKGIKPHECLVLGSAGDHPYSVGGAERKAFNLPPTDLMVLDVDGMPYVEGHSDDTLRADPETTIRAQLVAMFGSGVDNLHIVVALSSRAGFTGDFRAHVWVGLSKTYEAKTLAEWQRSHTFDWLDSGIFQAGRVLFAAPPEIDEDPFPVRVFDFVGNGYVLDLSGVIKSTEGLVPLTKPTMRGRHGLYRMNEDRLLASEFVSEECFNFVLSAKRAGMSEDDTIAAMHVEFERIGVPAATWRRMRGKGMPLGDARRMYRAMRAGESKVFGEPAYREPETTLDAATEALRAAVADQLGRECESRRQTGPRKRLDNLTVVAD